MAMGCMWTTYRLCVCVVREVLVACGNHGGHRVCVDYLWVMCVL